MARWCDMGEQHKLELVRAARQVVSLMTDFELMRAVFYVYDTSLSHWADGTDVAVNIAYELEAYDRNLMGQGRRVVPEFEDWYAEQRAMRDAAMVYVVLDDGEDEL